MSTALSDDRWYVVSTSELAATLDHADNRIRMARESLDAVHQDLARSIVALGDIEIEVRKNERGGGHPFARQEAFEELRRRSEQTVCDADEVRQHLAHTRGALEASQVLLAGMPAPDTDQERVDQAAMHARLAQLHRSLTQAVPMVEQVSERMRATGKRATQGRDRVVGNHSRATVDELTQDVTRSRAIARELDAPVDTAEADVHRAAAQAQAVAGAARLRANQSATTRVAPPAPGPSGIRR